MPVAFDLMVVEKDPHRHVVPSSKGAVMTWHSSPICTSRSSSSSAILWSFHFSDISMSVGNETRYLTAWYVPAEMPGTCVREDLCHDDNYRMASFVESRMCRNAIIVVWNQGSWKVVKARESKPASRQITDFVDHKSSWCSKGYLVVVDIGKKRENQRNETFYIAFTCVKAAKTFLITHGNSIQTRCDFA